VKRVASLAYFIFGLYFTIWPPSIDNRRGKTKRTIVTWTKTTGLPKIMETVNYYKSILFIYQFS
jgi:hypothetical protein